MVGLRGFKLNLVLLRYIGGGPPAARAGRLLRRREHRLSKRLSAEKIERLVSDYLAGSTAAEVGQRYGVAKSSVLRMVRQAGELVRHPRLSRTETAQLVALYEEGLSQKDIAERLGRSPSAVWHCLRRAGLVGVKETKAYR